MDGAIYIPKKQGAAAIVIAFNGKDFPLALLLQKNLNACFLLASCLLLACLLVGNIYKPKGKDGLVLM